MRTLDLMRHMDQNKYKFHFCVLSGLPGDLDDEVRSLGGEVYYIKLGYNFPRAFRRLLRFKDFQVVHSHVHFFSGYILRLAAQEGVSGRIAHFRNTDDGKKPTFLRLMRNRIFKSWINKYATGIVAVCEGAMSFAWGQLWKQDPRCRVIYNGLDVSGFNAYTDSDDVRKEFNLPEDCKLFIHVGRMVPQKNHNRVITIFNQIAHLRPNVALLLVGRAEANLEPGLRQTVSNLKLSAKVAFAGERRDVPRLLKASDVMIFPSLWEGLPGAVLESCAVGTPVLGSDLPGIREIAAQFPSFVKFLPLESSDSEWAIRAESMIEDQKIIELKSNIPNLFNDSMFSIDRCIQEFSRLWENELARN